MFNADAEVKITSALDVYQKCLERQTVAEANVQKSLVQLHEVAETSTFELRGQWYQMRKRKGRLYLCKLDGKPKGRPKKTLEQKEHDRAEREQRRAEAEPGNRLEETDKGSGNESEDNDVEADAKADGRENAEENDEGSPSHGDGGDREHDAGEPGSSEAGDPGTSVPSDPGGDFRSEEE